MNQEEKFWLTIWALVAVVAMCVAFCITISSINKTNEIAEAIRNGADPMEARCAIDPPVNSRELCK